MTTPASAWQTELPKLLAALTELVKVLTEKAKQG